MPDFLRFGGLVCLPAAERGEIAESGIHFDASFDLSVDCDQPKELRDIPVHGHGTGVVNADKTSSADLTISAITSSDIHFEGSHLGVPQPAPGGTGTISLIGRKSCPAGLGASYKPDYYNH